MIKVGRPLKKFDTALMVRLIEGKEHITMPELAKRLGVAIPTIRKAYKRLREGK